VRGRGGWRGVRGERRGLGACCEGGGRRGGGRSESGRKKEGGGFGMAPRGCRMGGGGEGKRRTVVNHFG